MYTKVLLIRHGEIDNPKKILYGGIFDFPLSNKGKKQILAVARKLKSKGYTIDIVYTSDLQRAKVSGEIIAKEFGIKEIAIDNNLRDIYIPALAGKPLSIRKRIHSQGIDEYSRKYVLMGNESREQITDRMEKTIKKIVTENLGKVIAMVSHGDPIRFLLFRLENPKSKIPSMHILARSDYPKKGDVVELTFGKTGNFLGKKHIHLK